MKHNDFAVVDLFCGAGGYSYGLKQAGFRIAGGVDTNPHCQFPFELNTGGKFYNIDVRHMIDYWHMFDNAKYRILVACAPCQAFSHLNNKRSTIYNKYVLLQYVKDIVKHLRPAIFLMENIPGFRTSNNSVPYHDFIYYLRQLGYSVACDIMYMPFYDVPQSRNRLFLIATLRGHCNLPLGKHYADFKAFPTVRSAIADLPRIAAGETYEYDPLHRCQKLTPLNLKRIRQTGEGQSWIHWDNHILLGDAHKYSNSFVDTYGRMEWDKPAPTLTTKCHSYGNGKYGHPEQDRAISLREAALLQGFPKTFQFEDYKSKPVSKDDVAALIGNAVPPPAAWAIGVNLRTYIESFY